MRILFISASPICKEISIGGTFLNLFSDLDGMEFASICTRTGEPDPAISRCFCITEKMLVRNLLGKGKAGMERECSAVPSCNSSPSDGKTAVRFVKKKRWSVFFWMQNAVWRVGRWKSKELQAFIDDYQPDVIFTTLSDKIYLNRLIRYVHCASNARLFVYAWDNNYSLKRLSFSPFNWITHFANRRHMRKVVREADKLYVISEEQKEDYEKAFHKPCAVVTKYADFSCPPLLKEAYGDPLTLVYTGNLYANRWKSLRMIVKVLQKWNENGTRAELRIYTGSIVTAAMNRALNVPGSSYIMGSIPSNEVMRVQNEADILVHAEAMDLKNRLLVRQSFSTKLIDYLRSARPILAVGSKRVASIKHLAKYQCAMVADCEQEVHEALAYMVEDRRHMDELVRNAFACGLQCHQKEKIISLLREDLFPCEEGREK